MTPFRLAMAHGEIAGYRAGAAGRPAMLFCHATGLCASSYRQMLAALGERFDVFALDLRGHGRSTLPADPKALWDWNVYARDIDAALDVLGSRFGARGPWILAGHSMGGVSSLLAAGRRDDVAGLRLIDPPIMPAPPWFRRSPLWPFYAARIPIVRGALNRRSAWPSRVAALESYREKRFFRAWAPGALEDYLADGLIDGPQGARLSCAPGWEAATFAAQRHTIWPAVRSHLRRGGALTLWGAGGADSPFVGSARARLRRAGAIVIEDPAAGHLWPLINPDAAAGFLAHPPSK